MSIDILVSIRVHYVSHRYAQNGRLLRLNVGKHVIQIVRFTPPKLNRSELQDRLESKQPDLQKLLSWVFEMIK